MWQKENNMIWKEKRVYAVVAWDAWNGWNVAEI